DNYYLWYDTTEKQFTVLSWDLNLALSGMGGGMGGGVGGMQQDTEEFYAMYEQAYAELYEQLIASGYAEESLNELTTRAEEAGDEGAATLAESIRSSLASLSETAPEPSAGMGMGPGRKTATTASE